MTHRYTFVRSRGFVAGGKCGICGREYSGKVCPYCTQTVLGLLAVLLLFLPALLGANQATTADINGAGVERGGRRMSRAGAARLEDE